MSATLVFWCAIIYIYVCCRFAFLLPRERILLCDIINEFGKRRDLDSALIAYQRYKERMTIPNMYVFRSIIDVCGLCGDHMKSRSIYEVLTCLACNFKEVVFLCLTS